MEQLKQLCLQEDITGLDRIVQQGLKMTPYHKKTISHLCVNEGKLLSLKWLFDRFKPVPNVKKLFQNACLNKKYDLAVWLYIEYNINFKYVEKKFLLTINKDQELSQWVARFNSRDKIICDEFVKICKNSVMEGIKFYEKYKNIVDEKTIDLVLHNACKINDLVLIRVFSEKKLICNYQNLFIYSLYSGYLVIINWVYNKINTFFLDIENCIIYEKLNNKVLSWAKDIKEKENIFKQFANNVKVSDLDTIKSFYQTNINIIKEQFKRGRFIDVLSNCQNRYEIFKWCFLLHKCIMDLDSHFKNSIIENNKKMVEFLYNKVNQNINLNDEFIYLCNHDNYEMVDYLIDLNFSIVGQNNIIFNFLVDLITNEQFEIVKKLQAKYNYLADGNYINLFVTGCRFGDLSFVKWMFEIDGFIPKEEQILNFYIEPCLSIVCDMKKVDIAIWLASLTGRYEIIHHYVGDDEYIYYSDNMIYDDESSESSYDDHEYEDSEVDNKNEVFEIILENQDYGFDLLGITEMCHNNNNESCLICKQDVSSMVQFNCQHICCLECLSYWYKENPEICPYCKKDIIWPRCKKMVL
jgi:hypothetical protein